MSMAMAELLHAAAAAGDLEAVDAAIAAGADVNARGPYGDTALNEAAEAGHGEVVQRLLQRGADIANVGASAKTPLMNASFAGHLDVAQVLLEHGARVGDDLLQAMQAKVEIFRAQADDGFVTPEGVKAWEAFLDFLGMARLRQDLPEIVAGLSADDPQTRADALRRIEQAAERRLDVSAAAQPLRALLGSTNADTRFAASKTLALEAMRTGGMEVLRDLLSVPDGDTKAGALGVVVAGARGGTDISSLIPQLVLFLSDSSSELRHDAPLAFGYLATAGRDVRAYVPQLAKLLRDPESGVRQMAAWALYRVAKYLGDIGPAIEELRRLQNDADADVRAMAQEAVRAAEAARPISR